MTQRFLGFDRVVAQSFTLTAPTSVTSVQVHGRSMTTGLNVSLYLTSALGPGASAADVVFNTAMTINQTANADWWTFAVAASGDPADGLMLAPGDYFVVLAADAFAFGWSMVDRALSNNTGDRGFTQVPTGTDWLDAPYTFSTAPSDRVFAARVIGQADTGGGGGEPPPPPPPPPPGDIPSPAGTLLLALGGAGASLQRRRR
ncbi:MAG: hypothetical protein D6824_00700 [Planctomycetota bacterium]|nr:MAG: hypothetical protein D6824_00700 [Planctomycetota bacterium]